MKQKPFFARPRNLCVLIVFAACLLGLAAGVVRNCVLYAEDGLSQAVFSHRMWFSLLCVVMMSVIFLAELLFRVRFPLFLELFAVVFAFCSVALSTVYGFYERIPPWDTIMHFASGPLFSSVGLCLAWLLFRDKLQGAGRAVSYALFALLFALAVGYLWEVYEYAYDSLTGKSLQGPDRHDDRPDRKPGGLGAVPHPRVCGLAEASRRFGRFCRDRLSPARAQTTPTGRRADGRTDGPRKERSSEEGTDGPRTGNNSFGERTDSRADGRTAVTQPAAPPSRPKQTIRVRALPIGRARTRSLFAPRTQA